MNARSVKAKGRRLQNIVRDALRDAFPSLEQEDIKSQTMGMTGEAGEDIKLSPAARKVIPYSFECKNQERLNLWASLKQAEDNTPEGSDAILVIKRNGTKPYVVIDFDKFINLIK